MAKDKTRSTVGGRPLSRTELARIDAWWRAANYLSVGQIYLMDNPLLREPLLPEHVKPRLLGHWGTTPGLNFVYAHLNRAIMARDLDDDVRHRPRPRRPRAGRVGLAGGHLQRGLPRHRPLDEEGMRAAVHAVLLPRRHPEPRGARRRPGSIHEGGELGYSLSHAYGAAFDNPDLVVAAVVGDGEAETGPLATSWHSHKFVDPRRDGAVLPILHLNGYKIANPTVLARIPEDELVALLRGYGHTPYVVVGRRPRRDAPGVRRHPRPLPRRDPRHPARGPRPRRRQPVARRPWPMIVLRSPKGWTGPKEVDGQRGRGLLALAPGAVRRRPRRRRRTARCSRSGCAATGPRSCSTPTAPRSPAIADLHPAGRAADERQPARQRRPAAARPADARLPRLRRRRRRSPAPARSSPPGCSATFLRDVMAAQHGDRFRMFSPDENSSNRLQDVLEVTDRTWNAETLPYDDHLAVDGRVMEILSEHTCEGWLEGYLLTGRHGLLLLLRGVHPRRRLDVQPARQVAEDHRRHPVAPADRVAELPAHLARVAAGPQRLLPPGPRASSTTW